jgi:predicted SnoaL-like aldol condensation-catalyzing enzyme
VVLVGDDLDSLTEFVDADSYAEHSPLLADGVSVLREALQAEGEHGRHIDYHRVHRVLAEGSFVLSVSEGYFDGAHASFYDLFRVDEGKVVEHWGTTEKIAPRSEWKNDNGKF